MLLTFASPLQAQTSSKDIHLASLGHVLNLSEASWTLAPLIPALSTGFITKRTWRQAELRPRKLYTLDAQHTSQTTSGSSIRKATLEGPQLRLAEGFVHCRPHIHESSKVRLVARRVHASPKTRMALIRSDRYILDPCACVLHLDQDTLSRNAQQSDGH